MYSHNLSVVTQIPHPGRPSGVKETDSLGPEPDTSLRILAHVTGTMEGEFLSSKAPDNACMHRPREGQTSLVEKAAGITFLGVT